MSVEKKMAVNILTKFLSSGSRFLTVSYIAIFLGPSVLGAFALYRTVVSFGIFPLDMGLQDTAVKRISESDSKKRDRFCATVCLISIVLFLSALPVLYLLRGPIAVFIGNDIFLFIVLSIYGQAGVGITNSVLKGENRIEAVSYLNLVRKVITSALQLGLAMIGMGLTGLVIGEVVGFGLSIMIGGAISATGFRRPNKQHFRDVIEFSKYSWITPLNRRIRANMDTFILRLFVGPAMVGVYELVWRLTGVFSHVSQALEMTLFPEISGRNSDDGNVKELIGKGIGYGVLSIVPGVVGGLVVGRELLTFFGPTYRAGYLTLVALLVARLLMGVFDVFSSYYRGVDRPEIMFRGTLLFAIINVALNLVLVSIYGIVGAAVATGIAFAISAAYFWSRIDENIQLPLDLIVKSVISASMMGLTVSLLSIFVGGQVYVGTSIAIGGLVYFGLLYATDARIRERTRKLQRG
jgi:O-antigen/teichoic acid export membrane protein